MSILNGETESGRPYTGHRGNCLGKKQGGGMPSLSPLTTSNWWLEILEKQLIGHWWGSKTNKQFLFLFFFKYQHQRKFKRSCSLLPYQTSHITETATFTRREKKISHRSSPSLLWVPFPKVKRSTALSFSWVASIFAEEWSTPTKAASEPQLYNYITIVISLSLYLFIYVYIKVFYCTGTGYQGNVLALLFAASGRLDWSYTREKHHEKRHHKVSRS